jgi:hypothetical protein
MGQKPFVNSHKGLALLEMECFVIELRKSIYREGNFMWAYGFCAWLLGCVGPVVKP